MFKALFLSIWYLVLLIFAPISIPIMMFMKPKKMSCEEYKAYVLKQNSKGKRLSKHLTNKQVIKQVWGY